MINETKIKNIIIKSTQLSLTNLYIDAIKDISQNIEKVKKHD